MLDRVTLLHDRNFEKFVERTNLLFTDNIANDTRKIYIINRDGESSPNITSDKLILVDETDPDEIYNVSIEICKHDPSVFKPKLDTPKAFASFYEDTILKLENTNIVPSILLGFDERRQALDISQMYSIYRLNTKQDILLYTINFSTSEVLTNDAIDYVRPLFDMAKKYDDFYNIKYKFHLTDPDFSTIHLLGVKNACMSEALDYLYNDILFSN